MMRSFDSLLEEEIAAYEGRHDDLIFQAPAFYRLLVSLLDDPRLPNRLRPLVLSAVAYFILPADIVPEDIYGPYGYADDIFLCAFVGDKVRTGLGSDAILTENWEGEGEIIPLIGDILASEVDLIQGERGKMLKYIGFEELVAR
ncbi:MAG TPA: DUF1232 domain-containing protein [Thermoleophilia bacterium]|nr:DUF1232 domain-containing protein [Thermoleophilia bacterium]